MTQHIQIAALDDLPEGRGLRVEFGEHRVAVFRIGEDVYAIGDRCSHAEASLAEGDLFDLEIECPRHGSAFDLRTGEPQTLPATKPVPTYETHIDGGNVFLTIAEGGSGS